MAQYTGYRIVKTNYVAPKMTAIAGSTLVLLGSSFIMKTSNAKLSINNSVFAPFDYNESTAIIITATYKFDVDVVITIYDEVTEW